MHTAITSIDLFNRAHLDKRQKMKTQLNTGMLKEKIINPSLFSENNTFVNAMHEQNNITFTENLAITNKSTYSYLLDWFGAGGALRQRNEQSIINMFSKAFAEDKLISLKILFYLRDIRDGQGERRTFRIILRHLAENYPQILRKNINSISFFGRWDDLYSLVGTDLENDVFKIFSSQLEQDNKNMKRKKSVSLLAKWLKSENTSSSKSKLLAKKTREALNFSPKTYRKTLSSLRRYIDICEIKMCNDNWENINFEIVPSKAFATHRKAFARHTPEKYKKYLENVSEGKSKINAKAIYPYELFRELIKSDNPLQRKSIDLQWKSMPNWLEGNEHHGIVVADTSGSMLDGIPNICVAVSLAIYFAERNVGPFKDVWINFSTKPSFQKLVGNTLYEKYNNMDKLNWKRSTNLQAVFNLILNTANEFHIKEKDMPKVLYIISDMEFNDTGNGDTNFEEIKRKYKSSGYELPKIIWWNVASRHDNFPITAKDENTAIVSGCSPNILKSVFSGKDFNPLTLMLSTVNNSRYDVIKI